VWQAALVKLTNYSIDVALKENGRRNIKRGYVKDLTVCDGGVKKWKYVTYNVRFSIVMNYC
jgi:hypothetical protein